MKLDGKDKKILEILRENANWTTSQVSKKTRVPITTVHNRIRRMKKEGVIKNYTVNVNFDKLGKSLKAFILITVDQKRMSQSDMGKKIKSVEDVEGVDIVTGSTDIIVEVRSEDMHALNDLITEKIRRIEGVDKTQTLMVLEEID